MTRRKFLAYYVPSALACWGLSNLIGVRNGTGASAAIGYGGGLALAIAAILAVSFARTGSRSINPRHHTADTAIGNSDTRPANGGAGRPPGSRREETQVLEFKTDDHEQAYQEVLAWGNSAVRRVCRCG
jgi:hypothetical protein